MRNKFLGIKLSDAEERALVLWSRHEGFDNKSMMMRQLFRRALKQLAPRNIFPNDVIAELGLENETAEQNHTVTRDEIVTEE